MSPGTYRFLKQEVDIPVGGEMRESNTILIFLKEKKNIKKGAAVKIAIAEELSKAVITPIKFSGISAQREMLFPPAHHHQHFSTVECPESRLQIGAEITYSIAPPPTHTHRGTDTTSFK